MAITLYTSLYGYDPVEFDDLRIKDDVSEASSRGVSFSWMSGLN
jgi:hypothetical protein